MNLHKSTNFTFEQIQEAAMTSAKTGITLEQALDGIITRIFDGMRRANELRSIDCKKLSKSELIELTKSLPELPETMFDMLNDDGFMTGSSVYTDDIKPNDLDYCICLAPTAFGIYAMGQSDSGYWEADGFSSMYAHHKGQLLNILCFSDVRLMAAWRYATAILQDLNESNCPHPVGNYSTRAFTTSKDLLKTKWKRVRLFSALRDVFYNNVLIDRPMDKLDALEFNKCRSCSQEAIFFTCKAARDHYKETAVCERCSGLTY